MQTNGNLKESLALLREKLGYRYAPRTVKILKEEYKRDVEPKTIYGVAHGRINDDQVLQVLCRIAKSNKSNTEAKITLLNEVIAA